MTWREGLPLTEISANRTERSAWACPDCGASLREEASELECAGCRRSWPVIDGVPQFLEEFPYWGEIPLDRMKEVNRLAATGPWKAALLESPDPAVRKASGMILNLDRTNWHWLLNLPPESRVLDLGAGMGANSHALGLQYREVVALEPVRERVQFMRQRFAQEGLSHVKVVRSSLWTLPFPPASFDLVLMNGVLEWVAEGRSGDPREIQLQALRNVHRLLRPGGAFYLGIENRMCLGYFIGYPDPHCGLPFVTVLPRPLAHWYARKKGKPDGYRNYLYSSRGYRKLLHQAGFRQLEVYLALPSYNHPRFLIPIDGSIFSYYTRNFTPANPSPVRELMKQVLLRMGLAKHVEFSFVILARK